MNSAIISVLLPAIAAFCIGIAITPLITHYLYTYRVWKKAPGKKTLNGDEAVEFNRIKGVTEAKTPRMGGMVIWIAVFITAALGYVLPMSGRRCLVNG